MSSAVLAALRSGAHQPSIDSKADVAMAEWKCFLIKCKQEETAMGGAFEPFQDMVEQSMNARYKELKGKGAFLIDRETMEFASGKQVEPSLERIGFTKRGCEERASLMRAKKDSDVGESRIPCVGSTMRSHLPEDVVSVLFHSPKAGIKPARASSATRNTQTRESEFVENDRNDLKQVSMSESESAQLEVAIAEIFGTDMHTGTWDPRPSKPTCTRKAPQSISIPGFDMHPADTFESITPSKDRQDSVQPVALQPEQTRKRHAVCQHMEIR